MQKTSKRQALTYSLAAIFIIFETVLGVLVQTAKSGVAEISYAAIILVFIFSIILFEKSRDWALVFVALLCTLCADYFLVLCGAEKKLIAMCFFSLTQICYFIRIYIGHESKRVKIIHIISRISLILVSVIATLLVLKESADALSIVSIIYYANLILNVVFAFMQFKRSRAFAIGLLLFAFCDAFIGLELLESLYMNTGSFSLLDRINPLGLNLAWVFYVPSQTLIALSLLKRKEMKNV